jgi:hypothetical protein
VKILNALGLPTRASDPGSASAGDVYFNSTLAIAKIYNGTTWGPLNEFALPFSINGALTVGVTGRKQRIYNRSTSAWVVVGADLYINTGPTGSAATIQLNKNGASAFTLSVAAGGTEANSAPNTIINVGDYIDFDVSAVGSTVAGSDLTLTLVIAS